MNITTTVEYYIEQKRFGMVDFDVPPILEQKKFKNVLYVLKMNQEDISIRLSTKRCARRVV